MKFLWLLALALCALAVLLPTVQAEIENEGIMHMKEEHAIESKLLNEVDPKDEAIEEEDEEDGHDEENNGRSTLEITEKDIEALKDPGMQRLARHLKSFHNQNLQRGVNNHVARNVDDDSDDAPEERAVRRRIRIRRRKTINTGTKRGNKKRQLSKRRPSSRRQSNRKNIIQRQKNQKFKSRKTKKNRRNRFRGKKGGRRRRYGVRSGSRRRNSNRGHRNRHTKGDKQDTEKPQNEKLESNINEGDVKPQTSP